MSKGNSGFAGVLRQVSKAWGAAVRRTAAPLALGLFASLSLVGHAGLPAKRDPAPAATIAATAQLKPAAAAQIAAINQVKQSATAIQRKIDSRLLLALMKQRGDARLSALGRYRFAKPGDDGRFLVDINLTRGTDPKAVLEALGRLEAPLLSPKQLAYRAHSVRARVALKDLEALAAMKGVSRIRQAVPAYTSASRTPGPVVTSTRAASRSRISRPLANALNRSEGVLAHGADQARTTYGASGQGQMICVLSDGVDALAASQASGDLPAGVTVLPGQAGSGDEGTAMLEIVHDMAPGATLGFATAFTSEASFAQNILDLATAGCTVIVDDVIYLDESPWQDGPVAQSVNTVTAAGVMYFSSAGNEGNLTDGTSGTWEGDFLATAQPTPLVLDGVGTLHDFGDGGQSLLVEAGDTGTPVVMIWGEHYTIDQGFAATDYDVYVVSNDLGELLDSSVDTQDGLDGNDFPIEFVAGGANAGERVVVSLFVAGAPTPPPFNLIVFRGEVDDALATSGATRGHSAAVNAFSTAATPAALSFDGITPDGPSPGQFSAANASESFSADGPRKVLLTADGVELTPGDRSFATGGVVRQKPDITAADGVSTSAPGFATFYGTSAAAPHAAAIAGLLRGAVPGLNMTDIRNTLNTTAIDIETPGVDRSTGVGIVMPVPALAAAGATPQPFLSAGTAVVTQISGDGDSVIEPGESFSISLPLSNIGATAATGISATLSAASSDVTVINGSSAYANIAVGGSASNSTAFSFSVAPSFQCGLNIAFTLNVAYNGIGSPQSFGLSQPTGSPGTPVSASYSGPVVPIPDAGVAVDAPVTIAGLSGAVSDVNVSIDGATCSAVLGATTVGIDHSFVSDLVVSLVAPSGAAVTLINQAGGGGNNFCQVALDDQSAGSSIQGIGSAGAPFTGSYTPASPLAGLDGEAGNGTWSLRVQDLFGADVGNIRAWSLSVTPAVCDAVPVPPTGPSVSSIVRAGSSPTNAASVSYTVTFSEPVSGVDAGDFTLTTTGALSGAAVTSVSGSAASYTVAVATGTGSGSLRLDLSDDDSILSVGTSTPLGGAGAANGDFIAGEAYAIDRDGPTVTIAVASGQPDPVTTAPVRFSVTLSESTTDFTSADVDLGGTAGATTALVSGSGSSYTVSVSGMTSNGTVTARVRSGAFIDAGGNSSLASTTVSTNFTGFSTNVGFTLATQSALEGTTTGAGTTSFRVTATLNTAAGSEITVPVVVDPASTATLGDDYSLSGTTLVFPAGSDSAFITVTVVRDLVEEADETIVLTLGTPTGGAVLGSPLTQIITVLNDDDTTPLPFSFAAVTNAALGSVQTSASATISGINQAAPITVSGGSYSISGGPFTSVAGTVSNGQTVTLRQTASSNVSTLSTTTVTIGGVSASYNVTTTAADTTPDAFSFAPVNGVAPGSQQTSSTITVAGINQGTLVTISAGGSYSINGGPFTVSAGSVSNGQTVAVRLNASNAFSTASTVTLTIGGVSGGFTVTTLAADTTPAAFVFAAVTGLEPGSTQTSNAITVQDINTATAISVTGGSYSINGGTFVATAGTVNAGDSVAVRVTASNAYGTATTATLSIGGISGSYSATTRAADLQPDPFAFTAVIDAATGVAVSSNAITVSGIEAAAAISVSGGQYSINGGAFTATAGAVSPGASVVVRLTSASANATLATATLAIGSGADQRAATFNVTTAAAPAGGGGGSAGGALLGFLGLAALWRRRRAV